MLGAYERASRLCASPEPEPIPRLVQRWLCYSHCHCRTHPNTYIPASCTRKYTKVPTPVPCCSAMPYRTYTPLPPPPPPRSPPGACAVAYAACAKKLQNQDLSFDPSHPSVLHPSLLRRRRVGRGSNLKCDVCQNYSPGDQALWQAIGGSVEGGDSTCADAIFVRVASVCSKKCHTLVMCR